MTQVANIRVNMGAPFPATVKGSGPIAISKQNGIWTVSLNFNAVAQAQGVPDPANTDVLVWNVLTGVFTLIPISAVFASKVVKILTGVGALASPYAALPTDEVLIVKQAAGAAFTVTVDWSARTKPLRVVDGKGDAAVNNITITPKAGQTQLAVVNYSYIIDGNGGSITLTPLPDNTGAY
jgi:hypothetical protein